MEREWQVQDGFVAVQVQAGDSALLLDRQVSAQLGKALTSCQPFSLSPQEREPPHRPDLGSANLGPFGHVAQWLLRTESLPLALITGLIGFGLLGAAGSSFIRARDEQNKAQQNGAQQNTSKRPLVTDMTGILIRGVTAAIAVFLAVEGGLTVFAVAGSTGTEPNPYVLLLTCLAAAVFSERIWKRVEEMILGTETKGKVEQGKDNGNPAPTSGPSGNGGTPPAPTPP